MSELDILYHDEVQLLDWGESRSGGKWIKFKLADDGVNDPLDAFRGLDTATAKKSGHIFNVTIVQGDIVAEEPAVTVEPAKPAKPEKGPYGEYAKALHQSGFLRAPAVWKILGTDEDYQAWCRKQPCAICGDKDYTEEYPEGIVEYNHVRRVANGAGTGIKPDYSGVPGCHFHHQLQTNDGELAAYIAAGTFGKVSDKYFLEHGTSTQAAKDWFDLQRMKYVQKWAHEQMKKCFFCGDSLTNLEPQVLLGFCEVNHLDQYLPSIYKKAREQ